MSAQETDHWWFVAGRAIIETLIQRHVPLPRSAAILEAGCGSGGYFVLSTNWPV